MVIDPHLLAAFVAATAVAMVVPGPDMIFVMACGARSGPRAGLWATCGVATGEAIHVTLAAVGLATLFLAAPTAFTVVRVLGAAYLIYLGVQAIRHRGVRSGVEEAGQTAVTGRQAFTRGLLTNLLNPKMVTFTIALLPQFVTPGLGHVWLQFAILGLVLVVFEFVVDGTVGVLAGRIGAWLQQRDQVRRGLDATVGAIFIGVGARLALDSGSQR